MAKRWEAIWGATVCVEGSDPCRVHTQCAGEKCSLEKVRWLWNFAKTTALENRANVSGPEYDLDQRGSKWFSASLAHSSWTNSAEGEALNRSFRPWIDSERSILQVFGWDRNTWSSHQIGPRFPFQVSPRCTLSQWWQTRKQVSRCFGERVFICPQEKFQSSSLSAVHASS